MNDAWSRYEVIFSSLFSSAIVPQDPEDLARTPVRNSRRIQDARSEDKHAAGNGHILTIPLQVLTQCSKLSKTSDKPFTFWPKGNQ